MNKRQAKKVESKGILLLGMNYKEYKKSNRDWQEYKTEYYHAHKFFKGFNEDEKVLIEMGVMTEAEVKKKYGMPKPKMRWRRLRKKQKNID